MLTMHIKYSTSVLLDRFHGLFPQVAHHGTTLVMPQALRAIFDWYLMSSNMHRLVILHVYAAGQDRSWLAQTTYRGKTVRSL